MVYKGEVNITP